MFFAADFRTKHDDFSVLTYRQWHPCTRRNFDE